MDCQSSNKDVIPMKAGIQMQGGLSEAKPSILNLPHPDPLPED